MIDYVDFHHDFGGCGAHFQTRVSTMRDFPERVVCPACPAEMKAEERIAAMKRLSAAITELMAAKDDLEKRFSMRIIKFPF